MSMRIRKDDLVVITTGKDRGKRGKVIRVLKDKGRVVVEGVNVITRHKRKNPQNPSQGGRVQSEAPIHISNVMPWSESENRGVRVKVKTNDAGKKFRVSARTGKELAPPDGATRGTAKAEADAKK